MLTEEDYKTKLNAELSDAKVELSKLPKIWTWKIKFGKYKDKTFWDVYVSDKSYLQWALEKEIFNNKQITEFFKLIT